MNKYIVQNDNIVENIKLIRDKADGARIIAVLKGNGYGIGVTELARVLMAEGIDFFAVNEERELIALREMGFEGDVLFLPSTAVGSQIERLIEYKPIFSIGSREAYIALKKHAKGDERVRVHINFDTGFGRYGFLPTENISDILNDDDIYIHGAYTHLSASFAKNQKHTRAQAKLFAQLTKQYEFANTHIANSNALFKHGNMGCNCVRVGSAFLGRIITRSNLKPVGYFSSKVIEVKMLPKGWNIGYANITRAKRLTKIGIVPLGSADGFGVKSNDVSIKSFLKGLVVKPREYVTINGSRYPILGRVNMCNFVIDITDSGVIVGDEVRAECSPVRARKTNEE
ncbi:MAG: alanine racemase [Clostridiales bacterium]|jgi:alanine racemase|nr:alanine racemase [Clostridiales bacterium]